MAAAADGPINIDQNVSEAPEVNFRLSHDLSEPGSLPTPPTQGRVSNAPSPSCACVHLAVCLALLHVFEIVLSNDHDRPG